ncbi:T6SS immunity protein Tdi1 domain-containing protein [Isoptericola sp. BMS4]|uniref:T6SS immunity protein Tdi1 domain-containing protein n=1 Tax=Isoptericola sp. BMS4 TaxID=2527875 RepID=UPI00196B3F6C|nr:T6SS immunity protein Tdi1 domain-containing protein [Isoptericola sp. BMS4]
MLRAFDPGAFAYGLTSWSWLGVHGKTPRFTTAFGDVFLESLEGWWFLDTLEGSLELRWPTAVELYAELESPEGRGDLLLEDICQEVAARGVVAAPDEVFTFSPHPAVGGRLHAERVEPVRLELALRLTGDMHLALRRSSGLVSPALPMDRRASEHSSPQPAVQPARGLGAQP